MTRRGGEVVDNLVASLYSGTIRSGTSRKQEAMTNQSTAATVDEMPTGELLDRLVSVMEMMTVTVSERVLSSLAVRAGELWSALATREPTR